MDVFVYGTLCEPARARAVLGHAEFGPDARLVGLRRVAGDYPTLAPGGETAGRVLRLGEGDLEALDRYEGVDRGLYVRVRIQADDGAVWCYVGDPDALGADAVWPGDGPLESRVRDYVAATEVRVEFE